MNISEFRSIASMSNALVVLDSKTEEIKVTRQTLIHRAIAWFRGKVSPNPMAGAERDAAHNRFLRAIADHSGYDSGDVSRAEALLSVDLIKRRPLSSRRIREVIQDLDQRSTPAMRVNRTTAAWMSRRGVDMRLSERAPGASISEDERESLSAKVHEAIQIAGGHGARNVDFVQASTITNRVVDGFLDERAAPIEAAAQTEAAASDEAPVRDETDHVTNSERDSPGKQAAEQLPDAATDHDAGRVSVLPTGSAAVAAEPPTAGNAGAPDRASRKDLLRTLDRCELPGNLKSEVRKLVKKGVIRDSVGLVSHANRRTADWILEHRVGRWYGGALKHQGVRRKIKHGEELMVSRTMLRQVTDAIVNSKDILNYPDVKSQSRALIAAHVRSEVDGRKT